MRIAGAVLLRTARGLETIANLFTRGANFFYGLLPVFLDSSELSRLIRESYTLGYRGARHVTDPATLDTPLARWEADLLDRHGMSSGAVLVMGTGYGREAIAIARRGARVVAIDTDLEALQMAARIAASVKVPVSFQQADLRGLPYAAGVFDFAFLPTLMYSSIQGRHERQTWLRKVARVLKPKGVIILSFLPFNQLSQSRLRSARIALTGLIAKLPGTNPHYQAGDDSPTGHFLHGFQDEEEVRTELSAAGMALLELNWSQGIAVAAVSETLTTPTRGDILPAGVPGFRNSYRYNPDMDWSDKVFSKNADFVHREVAGESILIPLQRQLTDVKSLYVLNETGASLWRRIDGSRSVRSIMEDFSDEFDVTSEELEKDFHSLIDDLLSIRAIQEQTPRNND